MKILLLLLLLLLLLTAIGLSPGGSGYVHVLAKGKPAVTSIQNM
jgi:hypothetical protein